MPFERTGIRYAHPLELPRSDSIVRFAWTGERRRCPMEGVHNDTHPMTWAADDEIYFSSGDPNYIMEAGRCRHVPWAEAIEKPDLYPLMGGLDVEKLVGHGYDCGIERINTMPGFMGPGGNGPKPSGMISVDRSLYLAAQNLLGRKPATHRSKSQHGSDATILRSDDRGRTWQPDIGPILADMEDALYDRKGWKWTNPPEERAGWKNWAPMFPGSGFGGPTFIQYGKDNAGARDSYVYAVSSDQWDNGSELRLGRVPKEAIQEPEAWQWAVPGSSDEPGWTSALDESRPVLVIDGHVGLPEMVYLQTIDRYLLLTWGLHSDFHVKDGSELTILEADQPWGPFRLVHYEEIWDSKEICPYCPRVPLKWFDGSSLRGWIVHSGNWHTVEHYAIHTQPFELTMRPDAPVPKA